MKMVTVKNVFLIRVEIPKEEWLHSDISLLNNDYRKNDKMLGWKLIRKLV